MTTKEIVRKALLSILLLPAAALAHLWFGHEYRGPGMNQIDVLLVTIFVGMAASFAFDVLSVIAHFAARKGSEGFRARCDWIFFSVLFVACIVAGLSAKVSDATPKSQPAPSASTRTR